MKVLDAFKKLRGLVAPRVPAPFARSTLTREDYRRFWAGMPRDDARPPAFTGDPDAKLYAQDSKGTWFQLADGVWHPLFAPPMSVRTIRGY